MITAAPSSTLQLRDYQQEAIGAVHTAAAGGVNRPLVVLPTGTGKTVIFAHLLAQLPGRALILAHRDELIRQAADKLALVAPRLDVGIVKAGENEVGARVIVASVQTLSRANRLDLLAQVRTLVVDEAHHAVAPTYRRILEHLGAMDRGGPLCVGFTATPERGDKAGLGTVWQKVVYQKSILEMMLAGYLCDLRAVRVSVAVDLDQVHVRGGDYVDGELGQAMMDADAPAHVVAAYQEHAGGRKALVFTPTVALAHAMAEVFQSQGVKAEALDGRTPDEQRRAILRRLHSGETRVVANCAVLTEGFDEPSIDCVIVARPTRSRPLYVQMVGRGTRVYPGKADCLVLDVVGATSRHALMTAPELFALDLSAKSVREAATDGGGTGPGEGLTWGEDGELVSNQVNVFRNRPMKWIPTDSGTWVLNTGSGFIRLSPLSGDRWAVHLMEGGRRATLWDALPLDYAMGSAEDFVRQQGAAVLADPNAPWRSRPVSEKQVAHLRKRGIPVHAGMTQGEASDKLSAIWVR